MKAIIALALAGAFIVSMGCSKMPSGVYPREAGHPVVFGIDASAQGGNEDEEWTSVQVEEPADTRTVYRGKAEDYDGTIQPIDWVAGDKIRIYSPECTNSNVAGGSRHWADYVVTPTPDNLSLGKLTNAQPNGLVWGDPGTYHFYGVYPSPGTEEADDAHTSGALSYSLPSTQPQDELMKWASMFARTTVTTTDSVQEVTLSFSPCFTAFEFDLLGNPDVTIKSVQLTSTVSIWGVGGVHANGNVYWNNYTSGGNVTHRTVTVPCDTPLPMRCTAFTLKRQSLGQLTLTITCSYQGTVRKFSLPLKRNGEFIEFASGKKHLFKGVLTPNMAQVTIFNAAVGEWETLTSTDTVLGY